MCFGDNGFLSVSRCTYATGVLISDTAMSQWLVPVVQRWWRARVKVGAYGHISLSADLYAAAGNLEVSSGYGLMSLAVVFSL